MSHFASYIYERQGKSIIEDEHGFATYYYIKDACYIEDIYVAQDSRRSGVGSKYADMIAEEAKSKGYTKLMGSVNLTTNGATDSLKALLAYGFQLATANNNIIFLLKDI